MNKIQTQAQSPARARPVRKSSYLEWLWNHTVAYDPKLNAIR